MKTAMLGLISEGRPIMLLNAEQIAGIEAEHARLITPTGEPRHPSRQSGAVAHRHRGELLAHIKALRERMACESKSSFEEYFRELRRPDVGDEANELTELDMVTELTEDGWPDACGWMQIFMRIHDGGELTPREREQALAYWEAGEELPDEAMRLPPCGPHCLSSEHKDRPFAPQCAELGSLPTKS